MIKSYFKISWRSLTRNKTLFAIHVTGLALGLTSCLLIMLYVTDELSYDRHFDKAGRLMRIVLRGKVNGENIREAITPAPVSPTLARELPEVEAGARLRRAGYPKLVYDNRPFRGSSMAFVDSNFFELFPLKVLRGDVNTWLNQPHTMVITRRQARLMFGSEDPMNKLVDIEGQQTQYRITGVVADVPDNSHFHFDVFASMMELADAREDDWMSSRYFSYVRIRKDADVDQLQSKLPDIVSRFMGAQMNQIGMSFEKFRSNGNEIGLYVQPVTDIHLHSDFSAPTELEPGGDAGLVYIFGFVAVFMLLIACINFINLSTAAAGKRMKEIGVKKVLGSQRYHLVLQFMNESFMVCSLAMIVAVLLADLLLPSFNALAAKHLDAAVLFRPQVIALLFGLVLIVTLLAGSYPAFYLSSVKTMSALRNKLSSAGSKMGLRSALVVFQFAISAGLIFCVIVVEQQVGFISQQDIGYDRERVLVLRESYLLGTHEAAFRNQLLADPRIESVSNSAFVPAGPTDNNMTQVFPGEQQEAVRRTSLFQVDDQYISTMGMVLVKGRNFSSSPASDSTHVIINETAVRLFNLGADPVGHILTAGLGPNGMQRKVMVIGVVKDFHFRSMREEIAPLMMVNNPYGGLVARVKGDDRRQLISDISKQWNSFHADEPFSYAMLDDLYNETFLNEQRTRRILEIFGVLIIFVACLGLFGLVTFNVDQRMKEIGIRKVLGANVTQIVSMLTRDVLVLVLISFFIAFPLGYYYMSAWLQQFAYRVEMVWWVPAIAGMCTLGVALLTMSFKTVQSALSNPVKTLRAE